MPGLVARVPRSDPLPWAMPPVMPTLQAAIVVFDLTSRESFEGAKTWVKELQRRADPNVIIALAGNKVRRGRLHDFPRHRRSRRPGAPGYATRYQAPNRPQPLTLGVDAQADLTTRRKIDAEEAQDYAKEQSLMYIETSAKDAINIEQLFIDVSTQRWRRCCLPSAAFHQAASLTSLQRSSGRWQDACRRRSRDLGRTSCWGGTSSRR
jgi:hypothetical protein